MNRLEDKVSIVTGAGSGIGRGVAKAFAQEGSSVVIADIDPAGSNETVNEIKSAGGKAVFMQTDVSKATEVEEMVIKTVDTYGRLNVLCNNAAFIIAEPPLISELSENIWDKSIAVNLKGVYLCCKYGIPIMIKGGGGSIINIASMAGLIKSPNLAYSSSKGGVIALTRSLALQCADYSIRVNAICPGAVDTPGRSKGMHDRKSLDNRLIRRLGTTQDIAYLAVYLASEEASYMTSSILVIDGGSLRG